MFKAKMRKKLGVIVEEALELLDAAADQMGKRYVHVRRDFLAASGRALQSRVCVYPRARKFSFRCIYNKTIVLAMHTHQREVSTNRRRWFEWRPPLKGGIHGE